MMMYDGSLIVSGLNHYIHKAVQRSTVKRMLINRGYDPDAIPNMSTEELYKLAYTVFGDMYSEAGRPYLDIDEGLTDYGSTNKTVEILSHSTRTHVKNISFSRLVFKAYYSLASTMGHELIHAIDVFSGNFDYEFDTYGKDVSKVMREDRAYQWMANHDGLFNDIVKSNHEYYQTPLFIRTY